MRVYVVCVCVGMRCTVSEFPCSNFYLSNPDEFVVTVHFLLKVFPTPHLLTGLFAPNLCSSLSRSIFKRVTIYCIDLLFLKYFPSQALSSLSRRILNLKIKYFHYFDLTQSSPIYFAGNRINTDLFPLVGVKELSPDSAPCLFRWLILICILPLNSNIAMRTVGFKEFSEQV